MPSRAAEFRKRAADALRNSIDLAKQAAIATIDTAVSTTSRHSPVVDGRKEPFCSNDAAASMRPTAISAALTMFDVGALSIGIPPSLDRHGARIGIELWVPFVR